MTTPTDQFVLFYGGPGSNWYPARFDLYGIEFANTEQAFMWHKAHTFGDTEAAGMIIEYGAKPQIAKRIGRSVRGYDDAVWCEVRLALMIQVNVAKFGQNSELCSDFLLAYPGKRFVEASPTDMVWGIGLSEVDPAARDESQWRGLNLLGIALDRTREILQNRIA